MAEPGSTDERCVREPSLWVVRFAGQNARHGAALDLACGGGRHSRYLARLGYRVTALDRDAKALATLVDEPAIAPICADLEDGSPWPLAQRLFDLVLVVNYLHRPILPKIMDAVADGGWLIYETFAQGQEKFGRPRNPDFLLRPHELADALAGRFEIVAFEEGLIEEPVPAMRQRIAAIKRA